LQEWDTTMADGIDELDEWHPDTRI
jgi:hypothetical protein